jgi:hypothetical protein
VCTLITESVHGICQNDPSLEHSKSNGATAVIDACEGVAMWLMEHQARLASDVKTEG